MQVEKTIKANVEVLTIKPTEIDTFWPLVEFLIAEALKFSGQYADAKHIKELCKKAINITPNTKFLIFIFLTLYALFQINLFYVVF